mmetsp:Transcript_4095/g.17146  ORF Transcript_4095/g.17146 Transcript_4095/m.17146 type:complete len:213 (+) Transcript_4095:2133-2771(+)
MGFGLAIHYAGVHGGGGVGRAAHNACRRRGRGPRCQPALPHARWHLSVDLPRCQPSELCRAGQRRLCPARRSAGVRRADVTGPRHYGRWGSGGAALRRLLLVLPWLAVRGHSWLQRAGRARCAAAAGGGQRCSGWRQRLRGAALPKRHLSCRAVPEPRAVGRRGAPALHPGLRLPAAVARAPRRARPQRDRGRVLGGLRRSWIRGPGRGRWV